MSAISELLLTRFWWHFKGRYLGTSRTDSNCHRDICPCIMHHLSWRQLSMSGISQQLLTQFWPNFKGRFLVPSIADANCHGNICSVHTFPGNNCPYKHNLSCYWPDFDQTFWTQIFGVLRLFDQHFFDQKLKAVLSITLQFSNHPLTHPNTHPTTHPPQK